MMDGLIFGHRENFAGTFLQNFIANFTANFIESFVGNESVHTLLNTQRSTKFPAKF
jgi:hypothetical protein